MKLLLDTCVWGGAKQTLLDAGHDVVWSGDWAKDPGDEALLAEAFKEGRILVTLDKDFGELAVAKGAPHSGIVRLAGIGARQQAEVCGLVLSRHGDELATGAIVTATADRIRIRAPARQ